MAAVTPNECLDGIESILLGLTDPETGGSIGPIVQGDLDTHHEDLVRPYLDDASNNPTLCIWELFPSGTDVINWALSRHEIGEDHLFTIRADRRAPVTGRETALRSAAALFDFVNFELNRFGAIRLGTGEPGVMVKPWKLTWDSLNTVERGGVTVFRAFYRTQLQNQPRNT